MIYSAKDNALFLYPYRLHHERKKLSLAMMEIRIRELEKELGTEKIHNQCLDKMIEIAERELKIDIRKKSGARQSMR
jgi:hypothetical protein